MLSDNDGHKKLKKYPMPSKEDIGMLYVLSLQMFVTANVHYEYRNSANLNLGGYYGRNCHIVVACGHNDVVVYHFLAAARSLLEYLYGVVKSFFLKTYHYGYAALFEKTARRVEYGNVKAVFVKVCDHFAVIVALKYGNIIP